MLTDETASQVNDVAHGPLVLQLSPSRCKRF